MSIDDSLHFGQDRDHGENRLMVLRLQRMNRIVEVEEISKDASFRTGTIGRILDMFDKFDTSFEHLEDFINRDDQAGLESEEKADDIETDGRSVGRFERWTLEEDLFVDVFQFFQQENDELDHAMDIEGHFHEVEEESDAFNQRQVVGFTLSHSIEHLKRSRCTCGSDE